MGTEEKMDLIGLSKLIAACSRAKVSKLKYGLVEVDFCNDTMALKEWPKMSKGIEVHDSGGDRIRLEADESDDSQMLLTDPLAYEKMQLEG